ncbi:MAG: flagellar basal body P-ring formation protein FlgA [Phycisphaerales bacterium]|nr:MAG: flagellar basal body P-ring formation protein FlgA [Phycisphaerales bacterium]
MRRKDCDNSNLANAREGAGRSARSTLLAVSVALAAGSLPSDLLAGSIRLWPSAVVVEDTARLADLAELRGFDRETESMLAKLKVTGAPPPGGSRVIHMNLIRSVLTAGGANMATVTLSGATQCAVTRPSEMVATAGADRSPTLPGHRQGKADRVSAGAPTSKPSTLRQAVFDYFNGEFARYGGRADVVFDRTSDQVLDLSGPAYQFRVRRRNGPRLGLIQLEVDVLADGRTVQTVPLVVQVSMIRRVVVARRAVNQGATIKTSDVELIPLSFARLDKLGIDDIAHVVGQRSKRFISAGSVVDPGVIESVPLVMRGQLVTLTSVAGAIRVVTTAKAVQDGLLGETVTISVTDNKRMELDAVVVGPGAVQIGPGLVLERTARVALGGQP